MEYSDSSNGYIYSILKNPNEINIGLINIEEGIIEVWIIYITQLKEAFIIISIILLINHYF